MIYNFQEILNQTKEKFVRSKQINLRTENVLTSVKLLHRQKKKKKMKISFKSIFGCLSIYKISSRIVSSSFFFFFVQFYAEGDCRFIRYTCYIFHCQIVEEI